MPVGVSTLRRERCRALRAASSVVRALVELCEAEMAFVVGSMLSGSMVKVSGLSMVGSYIFLLCSMSGLCLFGLGKRARYCVK